MNHELRVIVFVNFLLLAIGIWPTSEIFGQLDTINFGGSLAATSLLEQVKITGVNGTGDRIDVNVHYTGNSTTPSFSLITAISSVSPSNLISFVNSISADISFNTSSSNVSNPQISNSSPSLHHISSQHVERGWFSPLNISIPLEQNTLNNSNVISLQIIPAAEGFRENE